MSPDTAVQVKEFCSTSQKKLVDDCYKIYTVISAQHPTDLSDYSFVVAPLSKAYEGYLKDFFLGIKLIDKNTYNSDRFRVGKTLNPSLRYKRFSIFQRLAELHDNGEELAEILWDAWKKGRNEILHYFPEHTKPITLADAEIRINLILQAFIKSGIFLDQIQK